MKGSSLPLVLQLMSWREPELSPMFAASQFNDLSQGLISRLNTQEGNTLTLSTDQKSGGCSSAQLLFHQETNGVNNKNVEIYIYIFFSLYICFQQNSFGKKMHHSPGLVEEQQQRLEIL